MHFLSHYPDFLITSCSQRILHSWMGDVQSIVLHGLSFFTTWVETEENPSGDTPQGSKIMTRI